MFKELSLGRQKDIFSWEEVGVNAVFQGVSNSVQKDFIFSVIDLLHTRY